MENVFLLLAAVIQQMSHMEEETNYNNQGQSALVTERVTVIISSLLEGQLLQLVKNY